MATAHLGEEGFRWFIGKVEDRDDPKKIGRVRVRIYNVHPFTEDGNPDKVNIPTDHLPWATPISSLMSAGIISESIKDGVGVSATGLMVDSTVFGFFADGNDCQIPIILGSLAGLSGESELSELPKSAIEENSVGASKNDNKVSSVSPFPGEPGSPYEAKYPYNKVMRSESGHLVEIDDTPNKERIHVYHKTGTYVEIDDKGQLVIKSVNNTYNITADDNNVYVGGNVNVYVGGDTTMTIGGDVTLKIRGNLDTRVDGSVRLESGGSMRLESGGNMTLEAPMIDLNPNS